MDLHIIEQIRGANMYDAKYKQVFNKNIKYANGLGKIKKALNIALDFGSMIENINDESAQLEQNVLVTKFRGCLPIKRLQSLSEKSKLYRGMACSHAINPQDLNLRIPFSNVDLNDNKV
ncbi:5581_t:CDS:2 [Gigaspora margarita]|uniref:5581_t:CDS:1 n=1 Tax=Gigaspora margarita TaxID=4874 RepID=A0ABN7UVM3_GIGMA|nr:5581_t:CDS:2 [Gigaspora margarita]